MFESATFHVGYVSATKSQAYGWFYLASGTDAYKISTSLCFIGWWKLNTGGSCLSDSYGFGSISVGGVIRNSQGIWVKGYVGFIGRGTSLLAELWAIYLGLLRMRVPLF